MKIADLKCGDSARIVRIEGSGGVKKRLLDLGLTKGCRIVLTRIAPLGDPVEIQLRGYKISVRKSEAASVELDDVIRSAGCGTETQPESRETAAGEVPQSEENMQEAVR